MPWSSKVSTHDPIIYSDERWSLEAAVILQVLIWQQLLRRRGLAVVQSVFSTNLIFPVVLDSLTKNDFFCQQEPLI